MKLKETIPLNHNFLQTDVINLQKFEWALGSFIRKPFPFLSKKKCFEEPKALSKQTFITPTKM